MIDESIFKFINPNDIEYFKNQISESTTMNSRLLNQKTGILKRRTNSSTTLKKQEVPLNLIILYF
jgi:hypothetical protein